MPITDDHGKAIMHQYRVIDQHGDWLLLYDQHGIGDTAIHEFIIMDGNKQFDRYRGITLEDAKDIFEKVKGN